MGECYSNLQSELAVSSSNNTELVKRIVALEIAAEELRGETTKLPEQPKTAWQRMVSMNQNELT